MSLSTLYTIIMCLQCSGCHTSKYHTNLYPFEIAEYIAAQLNTCATPSIQGLATVAPVPASTPAFTTPQSMQTTFTVAQPINHGMQVMDAAG